MARQMRNLDRARATARDFGERALSYPNVFGCGAGERSVNGKPTGEAALVVLVRRKLPLTALRADEILPRALETAQGPVPVDVVEARQPTLCVDQTKYRPLVGGCEIRGPGSGTLGGVFYDRKDTEVVLLTCNHVVPRAGARGTIPSGTLQDIQQPDSGLFAAGNDIGRTKRIVPMVPSFPLDLARVQAPVDAAIIQPNPGIAAEFKVIGLGTHPFVPLPPYPGLAVSKRGKQTELTNGTVELVDFSCLVMDDDGSWMRIGGPGIGFTIKPDPGTAFSQRGDSGALIIDDDGAATRGMLFAGDNVVDGIAYACAIGAIMRELDLVTPCTGALDAVFMRALRRRRLLDSIDDQTQFSPFKKSKAARFRARHMCKADSRTIAGALEAGIRKLAPQLAAAIAFDEDFAGLLERAIGEFLIQPTLFDMLEYPIPKEMGAQLAKAFARLAEWNPEARGLEWAATAFDAHAGESMRQVLGSRAPRGVSKK